MTIRWAESRIMKASRFFLAALFFAIITSTLYAERRALTVFIGDYPKESRWSRLNSSNDKIIILDMLKGIGFQSNNITCLEDYQATFKAINNAFERLIMACRPGDQVYIHFSCHGQWVTDLDGDESLRSPRDRYDESVVPYDAAVAYGMNGYKGENHLVDDRINEYLCRLEDKVGKRGSVVVVIDACHSGDAQRLGNAEIDTVTTDNVLTIRGVKEPLELPATGRTCFCLPREAKCLIISACKSFESNHECNVGGIWYGRLSYAISKSLARGMTPEALKQTIEAWYYSMAVDSPLPKGRKQSPQVVIPSEYYNRRLF